MNEERTSQESKAPAGLHGRPSQGGLAVLESEVADLREENARLQRRLEESEMSAEFQARAERILAIPLPEDA